MRRRETLRSCVGLSLLRRSRARRAGPRRRRGGGAQPPPLNLPADTPRITAAQDRGGGRGREAQGLLAADGRSDLQLRRAGLSGVRDVELSRRRCCKQERVHGRRRASPGIPTAFMATWGSGKPVIALGSDIDGIPQSSQKPGVAYRDPLVEGAPGHGEGHNSGQAVNITAAIVLKKIMEREKIPGTIRIWPGVAEELVGTKAYFIRAGLFKDVDVALFTHVGRNLSVSWGDGGGTGLVSVLYSFKGESAHAAGAPVARPQRARRRRADERRLELPARASAAVAAVALRDQGRRRSAERRAADRVGLVLLPPGHVSRHQGDVGGRRSRSPQGAAMMTDTTLLPTRVLGSAWPRHFNRAIAEVTHANIQKVGMPEWSEDDQAFARAVQKELGVERAGPDDARRQPGRAGRSGAPTPAAARTTSATSRGTCRR